MFRKMKTYASMPVFILNPHTADVITNGSIFFGTLMPPAPVIFQYVSFYWQFWGHAILNIA